MNYRRLGRWAALGAAGAAGVAAAGVGLWWLKERRTERPDHITIETDGDYELRDYPALVVAETVQPGARDRALGNGFGVLAGYIFAGTRAEGADDRELAMTVPVLHQQDGERWRVRFVMPNGETKATLPAPGGEVAIATVPARLVAVTGAPGKVDDHVLAERVTALRAWIEAKELRAAGPPEFAFYNSPFVPGPLRRNEVWIEVERT